MPVSPQRQLPLDHVTASSWVTSCLSAPVTTIDYGTSRPATNRWLLLPSSRAVVSTGCWHRLAAEIGGSFPDDIAQLCNAWGFGLVPNAGSTPGKPMSDLEPDPADARPSRTTASNIASRSVGRPAARWGDLPVGQKAPTGSYGSAAPFRSLDQQTYRPPLAVISHRGTAGLLHSERQHRGSAVIPEKSAEMHLSRCRVKGFST